MINFFMRLLGIKQKQEIPFNTLTAEKADYLRDQCRLTPERMEELKKKARYGASHLLAGIYGVPAKHFLDQDVFFADAIVQEIELTKCFEAIKAFPDINSGTKDVFMQAVSQYLLDTKTLEVAQYYTMCMVCERLAERFLDAKLMEVSDTEGPDQTFKIL